MPRRGHAQAPTAFAVACLAVLHVSSTAYGASPIHVIKLKAPRSAPEQQEAAFGAAAQPRIDVGVHRESAECRDLEGGGLLVHEEMLTPGLQILRGGFGVIGISGGNNVKSSASQSNLQAGGSVALGSSGASGAVSGASTPRGGTAFTKIVYAKVPGEIPKTVEVAGSWSKFKHRNAMTKNSQGDFEIIMELPRGQHEIKFVINGETWRCHPDLETKRDSQVAC